MCIRDSDYVDNLVVEVYNVYIDEMKKYPNTRYNRGPIGGIRYACLLYTSRCV